MTLRLTLPLPAKALSPNARVHWAHKARVVKEHREFAWAIAMLAISPGRKPKWERAEAEATFYWPTRHRRDRDNAAASLKAYWDGIADAGVLADDAGLVHLPVRMEHDAANPRVEVIIRALEET